MRYFSCIIIALVTILNFNLSAQKRSLKNKIDSGVSLVKEAYINYDKDLFKNAKEIFEYVYSKDKLNNLALYYIAYTEFRFLEMSLTSPGEENLFNEFYDSALTHATIISQDKLLGTEGKILQAGIYMFKMATDMSKAPNIYPTVISLLNDVVKSEPGNPRAQIIFGRIKYNTPTEFGGGIEAALSHFNKAISFYEGRKETKTKKIDWGHLDALIWAAQMYDKMGNTTEVDNIFNKIIKIAPNFELLKCIMPQ